MNGNPPHHAFRAQNPQHPPFHAQNPPRPLFCTHNLPCHPFHAHNLPRHLFRCTGPASTSPHPLFHAQNLQRPITSCVSHTEPTASPISHTHPATTCHVTHFGAQDPASTSHTPRFTHRTYDNPPHHWFHAQNLPRPAMSPISCSMHKAPSHRRLGFCSPCISFSEPPPLPIPLRFENCTSASRYARNTEHRPMKHHYVGIWVSTAPAFCFRNPQSTSHPPPFRKPHQHQRLHTKH